jgi:flagellar biosynthetic protein FliP
MNTARRPRWPTLRPGTVWPRPATIAQVAAVLTAVLLAAPVVMPTVGVSRAAAEDAGITATSLEVPAAEPPSTPGASPALLPGPRPFTDWRVFAAVAGCCLALVALRMVMQRQANPMPPDVFEVLGSAPLAGRHAVRIVRFGPKTLLVGVSATGCTTLAEISDPQATACIAAACRGVPPPAPRPSAEPAVVERAGSVTAACLLLVLGLTSAASVGVAAAEPPEPAEPAIAVATDAPVAVTPGPETAAPDTVPPVPAAAAAAAVPVDVRQLLGPDAVAAILPSALLFGVVSLAPAVLLMTTCFVRISVVLALVRQGLGAVQIPSNQILAALAIFLSALVMWPVWTQAWRDGVEPFQRGSLEPAEAFDRGTLPVRRWMATQIETAGNRETMLMLLARHPAGARKVTTYDDVPLETLLPAFLVSELETAFTIGFRLLLPFLVLDLLVATLVVSTGLVMLPPTLVSLPLKLLVFIAADGWTLVVQSLLDGVRTATS